MKNDYRLRIVEPDGKRPRPWPDARLDPEFSDRELRPWLESLAADHSNSTPPKSWLADCRVEVLHPRRDEVLYTYHGRED